MISYLKIVIPLLFVAVGTGIFGYEYGKRKGMDMYHQQCYNIGGIIINEDQGTVVQCALLTTIPKSELDKYKV